VGFFERFRQRVKRSAPTAPPVEPLEREDVELVRFFFVLPEPVALPDGFQFSGTVGDGEPHEQRSDDPLVGLTFYQTEVPGGRMESSLRAMMGVTARAPGLPEHKGGAHTATGVRVQHTVVDAVTTRESPDAIPDDDAHDPQRWSPRADALTRCITLTDRVLRAHRQATESTYGALAYVRLSNQVLAYSAQGIRETVVINGDTHVFTKPVGDWGAASVIMLDHWNLADPFAGKEWDDDVAERFDYWLREQERGNPTNLWRERFIEANRALKVTGEMSNAVIQSNTSCEVLLDTVLALLLWEEGEDPKAAAPIFEHGKVLRRVTREYPARLQGTWSTKSGAIGDWYTNCYRLRHRVVHAGYTPSPREAQAAVESALGLQRFLWERIAARRTAYPRSALMTLARQGLEQRGLWSGQIRRFAEEVAPTEPNWRDAYSAFYRDLMDELLQQDGS
jgi:hypothetical protein